MHGNIECNPVTAQRKTTLFIIYVSPQTSSTKQLKSNSPTNTSKYYIGICEDIFKKRFSNHKKSFNHQPYENGTELSRKEIFKIKNKNEEPAWKIKKKCTPFNPSPGKCNLCFSEKLLILERSSAKNILLCLITTNFKLYLF